MKYICNLVPSRRLLIRRVCFVEILEILLQGFLLEKQKHFLKWKNFNCYRCTNCSLVVDFISLVFDFICHSCVVIYHQTFHEYCATMESLQLLLENLLNQYFPVKYIRVIIRIACMSIDRLRLHLIKQDKNIYIITQILLEIILYIS